MQGTTCQVITRSSLRVWEQVTAGENVLWHAGLIPMLAAPQTGAGDNLLSQVLSMAVSRGLVKAKQHVVCVLSVRGDLVLNVCQVDDKGSGMQSNLASLGEQRHTAM